MEIAIRKIGNSEGVIFPKELIARHKLATGDRLSVIETLDGFKLIKADDDFEKQMEAARKGMRKYRTALAKLAK